MKKWAATTVVILGLVSLPSYSAEAPFASTTSKAKGLSVEPTSLFAVFPRVGYVNQARTIFFSQLVAVCPPVTFVLDTALIAVGQVSLRTKTVPTPCPLPPVALRHHAFDFTPSRAGIITVRWDGFFGPFALSEQVVIETLPAKVISKFDVNGPWFDTATSGSGISLHHRREGSDNAFGTWFMFNNSGGSRWYTIQSASWQEDGSVLEGLLREVSGSCPATNLAACPAAGTSPQPSAGSDFAAPPAVARITFQSATRARADVSSLSGVPLFSSELTKLAF